MYTLYLKEFIDLYETCNYQETAENMNISTSSLSKHITKLEEECGVPLFDRTTRSVVPNEYGTTFLEYAKQIVDLEERSLRTLQAQLHKKSGVLTIGYMPVMTEYELLDVLLDFMQRYPKIEVKTVIGNRCAELFDTNHCDFVFFDDYSQCNMNLNHFLCLEDRLVVLLPLDHPLAKEKQISIEQLRDERFIMHGTSQTDLCRDALAACDMCRAVGFEPDIFLTSSHTSTIMRLVRKGVGVAVLNRFQCPVPLSTRVAFVNLEPSAPFYLYCLYRKDIKLSPTQKQFLSFIREYAKHWPVLEYSALANSPNPQW
ncbi:MAG: LysR family transcriptional regulator [Faecousia sp.]